MQAGDPKPEGYDSWTEVEKMAYKKYKKLPKRSEMLIKKDRQYFDSADWAKNKATGALNPKPKR